ncbi:hypothetical protein GS597_15635 [Synechococcales cyanobacterium C]|uniref:Uncharacterized protein n=1 Tax=Petrachloros mirabilis ULC683 TaxID=2781853 RepID=A0A8K2A1T3_9CYAN|nr:hypothetical protein [Petrachloros mirabilis]NCJ07912.1 hypothetical protein [Petrachloros mirabilis ULC683]
MTKFSGKKMARGMKEPLWVVQNIGKLILLEVRVSQFANPWRPGSAA